MGWRGRVLFGVSGCLVLGLFGLWLCRSRTPEFRHPGGFWESDLRLPASDETAPGTESDATGP